ncbi:hypothetical protein EDB89DRAFT_2064974 [Lactarius sanguifluus]|nr:hypothetical protein EDB89DRAFT_2064974 [Lactarius sanguifluus]
MTNNLWDWDSRASIPTVPCLPYPPPSPAKFRQKAKGGGKFTVPRSHTSIPAGKTQHPEFDGSTRVARVFFGSPFVVPPPPLPPPLPPLPPSSSSSPPPPPPTEPLLRRQHHCSLLSCSFRQFDGSTRVARVFFGSPFVAPLTLSLPSLTPEGCCILVP